VYIVTNSNESEWLMNQSGFGGYPNPNDNQIKALEDKVKTLEEDNVNMNQSLKTIHINLGNLSQNSDNLNRSKKVIMKLVENDLYFSRNILPETKTIKAFALGNIIFTMLGCSMFYIFGSKKTFYCLLKEDVSKKVLLPLNSLALLIFIFPDYLR